jgi:hypothetical protein
MTPVADAPGSPSRKLIFVSGCYWHMHTCGRCRIPAAHRDYWVKKLARNAVRDKRTHPRLRRSGWRVMGRISRCRSVRLGFRPRQAGVENQTTCDSYLNCALEVWVCRSVAGRRERLRARLARFLGAV